MTKICLNMIVKDEKRVIRSCLKSVKPLIDYWIIVDTGSKDGTQNLIEETLDGVPGELHEQPFVNFAHNRNEALKYSAKKGDYLLLIDADQKLMGSFEKSTLVKDLYLVKLLIEEPLKASYRRPLLINNHLDWSWKGVIHETLHCTKPYSCSSIEEVFIESTSKEGRRSLDPTTFINDAKILEKELLREHHSPESLFYLGESYFNARDLPMALKYYEQRSKIRGWEQHTFWAKYRVGYIQEHLNMDPKLFIKSYADAYHYRQIRAEPLFRLAQHFLKESDPFLAYLLSKHASALPIPNEIITLEDWIYSWGLDVLHADSAFQIGKREEAVNTYEAIKNNIEAPAKIREHAKRLIQEFC